MTATATERPTGAPGPDFNKPVPPKHTKRGPLVVITIVAVLALILGLAAMLVLSGGGKTAGANPSASAAASQPAGHEGVNPTLAPVINADTPDPLLALADQVKLGDQFWQTRTDAQFWSGKRIPQPHRANNLQASRDQILSDFNQAWIQACGSGDRSWLWSYIAGVGNDANRFYQDFGKGSDGTSANCLQFKLGAAPQVPEYAQYGQPHLDSIQDNGPGTADRWYYIGLSDGMTMTVKWAFHPELGNKWLMYDMTRNS